MGIGMVVVVAPGDADAVQATIPEASWRIGTLVHSQPGSRTVHLL
jgi:phosphoribosylaminoimidazole (AIR) synthetase